MGLLKEFKDFAVRGNVIDMAVGVIIGNAFSAIVKSLVDHVIMPPISAVLQFGGSTINLKSRFVDLVPGKTFATMEEAQKAGAPVFAYGAFLQGVLDFIILAFCVFLMVKAMNMAFRRQAAAPPPPAATPQEKLLTEIRDLLASRP